MVKKIVKGKEMMPKKTMGTAILDLSNVSSYTCRD